MYTTILRKIFFTLALSIFSSVTFSATLCHTCELSWVDTEDSAGIIVIRPVDGSGTGICTNQPIRTSSGLSDRQKDQIFSVSMAALVAGKKITASGSSQDCNSLNQITIKK